MNLPIYSIRDLLNYSINHFSDSEAFYVKNEAGEYSSIKYNEFGQDVNSLGTSLIDFGLKGKRVAIISENRYEWCVSYMAVVSGVGVVVPIDKELPVAEMQNLLIRSEVSAVIFSEKYAQTMTEISQYVPDIKFYINIDSDYSDGDFISFSELIEKGLKLLDMGNVKFLSADINTLAMSVLIFTSGTTDLAKGVMLSQKNICENVKAVSQALEIKRTDSCLSILPLHHTYECTGGFLTMIYNGCRISFAEGLRQIPQNLKEVSPTILVLVPLIIENMHKKVMKQAKQSFISKLKLGVALFFSRFLLQACATDVRKEIFKKFHDTLGGRVRLVVSGAAGINVKASKDLGDMGLLILQGYGLTEASPIVTVNPMNRPINSSIGKPVPGVEVKINQPNDDGIGEIIVKGQNVMLGYYQNEDATNEVLKDGWLYTGDIGREDNNGYFYISGRQKNVIVTKNGKNIYPEEVEFYLNESDLIAECLVTGYESEETGETWVQAEILPDYDEIEAKAGKEDLNEKEIYNIINEEIKKVNHKMPLHKTVRKFKIRLAEFEKTTTKKIKRYSNRND